MNTPEFLRGLNEYYQGEVIGEVLFDGILRSLTDVRHRYVMGSMLQLETETKVRLRPLMEKHGLSICEDPMARAEGLRLVAATCALSWLEIMQALKSELEGTYVPRYEEIAKFAPPEEETVFDSMVRHERSLLEVAVRELSGDVDNSVMQVVAQLSFPLRPPIAV